MCKVRCWRWFFGNKMPISVNYVYFWKTIDLSDRAGWWATKGPSWGYPRCVLGAIGAFCQLLAGKGPGFQKNLKKLTFEYPHEEPGVRAGGGAPPPAELGLRLSGFAFRVQGSGLWFDVQDSGFRVQDSGFRIYPQKGRRVACGVR